MSHKTNITTARMELLHMLAEISDDALEYAWRPIVYAYYWVDQRDVNRLTNNDLDRLHLIGDAAHGTPELVAQVSQWSRTVYEYIGRKARTEQKSIGVQA